MQTLQYIILFLAIAYACFALWRMAQKKIWPKKFKDKGGNCDQNCGCS